MKSSHFILKCWSTAFLMEPNEIWWVEIREVTSPGKWSRIFMVVVTQLVVVTKSIVCSISRNWKWLLHALNHTPWFSFAITWLSPRISYCYKKNRFFFTCPKKRAKFYSINCRLYIYIYIYDLGQVFHILFFLNNTSKPCHVSNN